jgi:hypothetical protein
MRAHLHPLGSHSVALRWCRRLYLEGESSAANAQAQQPTTRDFQLLQRTATNAAAAAVWRSSPHECVPCTGSLPHRTFRHPLPRALSRQPVAETPLTDRSRAVPDVTARQLAGMWQRTTAHAHAQACMHALHDAILRVRSTPGGGGGGGGEETTALSCAARTMISALLQHPDAAVVEMALPAMSVAVRRWPEEALGFLPCILDRVRELGTQLASVPVASRALALSQLMLKLLRAMAELSVHPACVAPLMQALSPLAAARSPVLLQVRV